MPDTGWQWDPSLYAGSAPYYSAGRVPYPVELVESVAGRLGLDGRGRALDVGCGPGSLTLQLAPWFEHVTGVDPDPQMLAEGRRRAEAAGISNVEWVHLKAEDLPADLGPFRLVTLAQSFHWMERAHVARLLHGLLTRDGALAHVHATTHRGVDGISALPYPRPPRAGIDALVGTYLGSRHRAGRGHRPTAVDQGAEDGSREAEIYRAAGFEHLGRISVPGRVVTRTTDEVVASVFSLSYANPQLFGDRMPAFERELRMQLLEVNPDGRFSEEMRPIDVDLWRV